MPNPPARPPLVGIAFTAPELSTRAHQLAGSLNLPLAAADKDFDFILTCTKNGLELTYTGDSFLTGSCRVDFVTGPVGFRRKHGGSELIIRAIGHKKNRSTHVLDATGGMGRDAFIMASHGCNVHIVERHPLIAALLEDGLHRASEQPDTKEIVERIVMMKGDSYQFLRESESTKFNVIYLDPMFPVRSKSSKVKKELQMLQLLAGHDENASSRLLDMALQAAENRVVVKRPKGAPSLTGITPSYSLASKKIRFDVYRITVPGPEKKHAYRKPPSTPG